ncbi:MAG: response regulator [Clostridia bacterium]
MYRVIIVDDEPLVRKRIVYGFDWKSLGFEIVGQAQNGHEAIELLQKEKPDLAIVDIMMPIMNGLELSEYVNAANLNIRLILLSAHSEFSYAQKAISYGVKAYVLKPIDEAVFLSSITQIRQELDQQTLENQRQQNLHKQNAKVDELIRSKQLSDYFAGNCNDGRLSDYGLNIVGKSVIYALRQKERFNDIPHLHDLQSSMESFSYLIKNSLSLPVCFYDLYNDLIIVICQGMHEENKGCFADQFLSHMHNYGFDGMLCGYSSMVNKLDVSAYKTAFEALNLTRYCNQNPIDYSKFSKTIQRYAIDAVCMKNLIVAINQNDCKKVCNIINSIFLDISCHCPPYHDLVRACQTIHHEITASMDISNTVNTMGEYSDLESLLKSVWTAEMLSEVFSGYVSEIFQLRCNQVFSSRTCISIAEQAKQMIEKNYYDNSLNIACIAGNIGISMPYMSSAFKKATGMSAVQYLSFIRLEHSRQLLQNTSKSIKTIAEESGFNDEYYYSSSFKKYYGFSPSHFRHPSIEKK